MSLPRFPIIPIQTRAAAKRHAEDPSSSSPLAKQPRHALPTFPPCRSLAPTPPAPSPFSPIPVVLWHFVATFLAAASDLVHLAQTGHHLMFVMDCPTPWKQVMVVLDLGSDWYKRESEIQCFRTGSKERFSCFPKSLCTSLFRHVEKLGMRTFSQYHSPLPALSRVTCLHIISSKNSDVKSNEAIWEHWGTLKDLAVESHYRTVIPPGLESLTYKGYYACDLRVIPGESYSLQKLTIKGEFKIFEWSLFQQTQAVMDSFTNLRELHLKSENFNWIWKASKFIVAQRHPRYTPMIFRTVQVLNCTNDRNDREMERQDKTPNMYMDIEQSFPALKVLRIEGLVIMDLYYLLRHFYLRCKSSFWKQLTIELFEKRTKNHAASEYRLSAFRLQLDPTGCECSECRLAVWRIY